MKNPNVRGKLRMEKKNSIPVSHEAFMIVEESENIEGLEYDENNVTSNFMKDIDRKTISEFLKCPDTNIVAVKNKSTGSYELFANNSIANETVKISGIGDHFATLVDLVELATEKKAKRAEGIDNEPLLSHDLIKSVNEKLLYVRQGEVGIGEYRSVDFLGREHMVVIGKYNSETGKKERLQCVDLERSLDGNIEKQMDKLINWANTEAFQSPETMIDDMSKFTARFVQIHPFGDGNGRTLRLLTNYIMLVNDQPMINIPSEKRDEYDVCLNYANAKSNEAFIAESDEYAEMYGDMLKTYGHRSIGDNRFKPLAHLLEECEIDNANDFVGKIIDYKKDGKSSIDHFRADQIENVNIGEMEAGDKE